MIIGHLLQMIRDNFVWAMLCYLIMEVMELIQMCRLTFVPRVFSGFSTGFMKAGRMTGFLPRVFMLGALTHGLTGSGGSEHHPPIARKRGD